MSALKKCCCGPGVLVIVNLGIVNMRLEKGLEGHLGHKRALSMNECLIPVT